MKTKFANPTQRKNRLIHELVHEKKFSEVLTIKEHDTRKVHCPRCKRRDVAKVIEPFFAKTASTTGSY